MIDSNTLDSFHSEKKIITNKPNLNIVMLVTKPIPYFYLKIVLEFLSLYNLIVPET